MRAFIYLALLSVFLALPASAEASGCGNVCQVRQQVIVSPFVQPVVVQSFVAQPVQAYSVVAVPVFQVQAVVQKQVVVRQRVIVRERRGPFFSLQIGR